MPPALSEGGIAVSRRIAIALVVASVVGALGVVTAWADGASSSASDGGSSVRVGASSSHSSPVGARHRGHAPTADPGSGPSCRYIPLPAADAAAAAGQDPGQWTFIVCPGDKESVFTGVLSWFRTTFQPLRAAPAVTPAPPVAARSVALQAESSLQLPPPAIAMNPAPFSVVNLPTWLWVGPDVWRTFSVTASAGGVRATATATPVSVVWTMGDGGSVTCTGPGTAYDPALSPEMQSTACAYTYRRSSAGQPSHEDPNDAAFPVTATIVWDVTWHAFGAPGGGSLPPLRTSSSTSVRVEQIESVETAR